MEEEYSLTSKEKLRAEIEAHTQEFLAKGGIIQQISPDGTGHKLNNDTYHMRRLRSSSND